MNVSSLGGSHCIHSMPASVMPPHRRLLVPHLPTLGPLSGLLFSFHCLLLHCTARVCGRLALRSSRVGSFVPAINCSSVHPPFLQVVSSSSHPIPSPTIPCRQTPPSLLRQRTLPPSLPLALHGASETVSVKAPSPAGYGDKNVSSS